MFFYLLTFFPILFVLIPFLSILCSFILFMPSVHLVTRSYWLWYHISVALFTCSIVKPTVSCHPLYFHWISYLVIVLPHFLLLLMKLTWRTCSTFVSLSQNYFIFLCNFPKNNAVDFLPVQYCCCWRWWLSTVFVQHIWLSWHPVCVAIWQSCCCSSTLVVVNLC